MKIKEHTRDGEYLCVIPIEQSNQEECLNSGSVKDRWTDTLTEEVLCCITITPHLQWFSPEHDSSCQK